MAIEGFIKAASEVAKEAAKEASKETARNIKSFDVRKKMDSPVPNTDNLKGPDSKKEKINIDKRIEKLQSEYINKAELNPDLNKLDPQAKGNYAEMKVDRDLASKGYERISKESVTDLKTNTGPGIDGVFTNAETGKTLITETKFNKSELGNTLDGKQMSSNWIDKRLDAAVGKDAADKIRLNSILNPDSVESVLAKVDLNGNISYFKLDDAANIVGGITL